MSKILGEWWYALNPKDKAQYEQLAAQVYYYLQQRSLITSIHQVVSYSHNERLGVNYRLSDSFFSVTDCQPLGVSSSTILGNL